MRDIVFKNLTSENRKRKVIASSEVTNKEGIHSVIHRHFICVIKEIVGKQGPRPAPYMHVLKERNSRERRERFFCKIKGSVYAVNKDKLYLILFMHTLNITLTAVPQELAN